MARHLQTCRERQARIEAADKTSPSTETFIHLQIQDAYSGQYWLHLEIAGSARLEVLDEYLRAIWLECCGHLSSFSVGRAWSGREIAPTQKGDQVFRPDREITHVYDFGTSSMTTIRMVAERQGSPLSRHPITLMARNEVPKFTCMECDREAGWLCMECIYEQEGTGALCKQHAQGHPHEEYGSPMLIVNSPRVGMCGYEGPAEPPY
jgi:hypothetical protein